MKLAICTLSAAAFLTISLAAQTSISPKAAAASGNTNNNIPYSWRPCRYQQVFDYDNFSSGPVIPIVSKQIAYRMQKTFLNRAGKTVELEAFLGMAAIGITAATATGTFDNNMDQGMKTLVISKSKHALPTQPIFAFQMVLKFDRPAYTFIPAIKRSLVLEVVNYGNSNNNGIFTYPLDCASGTLGKGCCRIYSTSTSNPGGGYYSQNQSFTGCPNKVKRIPTHDASAGNIKVGGTSGHVHGNSYLPAAPAILVLGHMALPANGVPIPGSTCRLMQPALMVFPGQCNTSPSGYVQFPMPIPNDPALGNKTFYSQLVFVQMGVNPLNVFTTRGLAITIGDGKTTPPNRFPSGTKGSSYGLVTKFK